jgi:hypothetical protein
MSDSPFTGPNKVEGKVCVSLRKMNLHYKISPGIGLSDNRAVEIRCFKSFTAYETASIESGGGGDIQQHTGDLREVNNKQFQMIEALKAYFPDS